MTNSELLYLTADKLEKPGAWTRKELARNSHGRAVPPMSPDAVCWCAAGAAQSIGQASPVERFNAIRALANWLGTPVTGWNDFTPDLTQEKVVDHIRRCADHEKALGR